MKRFGLFAATLLALPLCGQAPPHPVGPCVKIILQAEPPPLGTPAVDTTTISKRLGDFSSDEGFITPAKCGDGWVIGILVKNQELPDGLIVADGIIRLSPLHAGEIVPAGVKEEEFVVVSRASDILGNALGQELVERGAHLLNESKVIPPYPRKLTFDSKVPLPSDPNTPVHLDFSQVKIKSQPRQPPYPAYAREHRIQGAVQVELMIGPDGIPTAAIAKSGPGALLAYALEWAMKWKFEPLTMNGHPEFGRFRLNMKFNLN